MTIGTNLVLDRNGNPIQSVAPALEGGVEVLLTSTASEATPIPEGHRMVRCVSWAADCRIKFGGSDVEAADDNTSMLFPEGVEHMPVPKGATHFSVIGIDSPTPGSVFQMWPTEA